MSDPSEKVIRTTEEMIGLGFINPEKEALINQVAQKFNIAITRPLINLIEKQGIDGPIGRQFIPSEAELFLHHNDLADPIGDTKYSPLRGIIHRYPDRALLTPLLHCPAYCRFCFRREKIGHSSSQGPLHQADLEKAIDYIAKHEEIWEIILTGGDPLMLSPKKLSWILAALEKIDHIKIIRIHTRVPIFDPERITPELLETLTSDKTLWMAIHCNHASEITSLVSRKLKMLAMLGIPLLGQTVLLKDINDNAKDIEDLFKIMVINRIKPYYLHQLDFARGTSHFRTDIDKGLKILKDLQGRISGLCQAKYVIDIPEGYGKSPVTSLYWTGDTIEDWQGVSHPYPKT